MDENQLRWLHHNRAEAGHRPAPPIETRQTRARKGWEQTRRGRAAPIGELVDVVLTDRAVLSELQGRLLDLLEQQAGPDLLEHVTSVGIKQGILKLETAEPAVLYDLRIRWQQRVLHLVNAYMPELGIREVRFTLAKRAG